ncbi:hypothetical protein [Streptomyces vietnamensis]|uniref:Uncharacterized protein n=1 Tax=Streptomyces vietnamensis TaxID=362257 RepID=A0A0B5I074_9ACTN|nr:hypothetical protein [Streptomyces vietnamensis]AJF63917.1 hypothetical protein SVTN_05305 [Streptomyces vietnamensis]
MAELTTSEWWALLPEGIRGEVDGYVLQDRRLQAARVVWETCRNRGLGLHEAEGVVHERYLHHGDRIARTPLSPLDLESLTARASGCPGPLVAIEAVWDGDTVHDWFVILLAITAEPVGEHHLATIYRETAVRHLGAARAEEVRRPEAVAAGAAGRALAEHLAVPFHFASPDTPDDEAPRRRP